MISSIYERIWQLSSNPDFPGAYAELQALTNELISIYTDEGRLDENPFKPTNARSLSLPIQQIKQILHTSTCLVTGGIGCVGSSLVSKLCELGVKKIIVVDILATNGIKICDNAEITYIQADIRKLHELQDVFDAYRPEFVFHTAAQRNPGLAEDHILDTIQTNILGTLNVATACEKSDHVQQCVFSSTGKASRYYTEEIYAATKKICEYIFDTYAARSTIKYSIVRFTHILENSLMNSELQAIDGKAYLPIHSPGKYVTAQNVSEAVALLLNALLYSKEGKCSFLIVRHLEWPVESLEVALYYIKSAGSSIPVIFKGNPLGYSEKFFRGQMDWSNPHELNLLINVYECRNKTFNIEGDIIISQIASTNAEVLRNVLTGLKNADCDAAGKNMLITGLKDIIKSALQNVEEKDTLNILKWGLQPKISENEYASVNDFESLIQLLLSSLNNTNFLDEAGDQITTNYHESKLLTDDVCNKAVS